MPEKPTYEELEKRIFEIEKAAAEHKLVKQYWRLANEVLMILNESADFKDSIQRVLEAVKQTTGCDAVGLRLQSGKDYPYMLQSGFSDDFLLTENSLLERDRRGELCRNPDGTVRLECTCGLVISGKGDHSNPLFTPGGSAWTNDSFPFLDLPEADDPRHHPRNQCIHQGYASIALIPIRNKKTIVGLLQVNGHKKGLFTTPAIHALERIASDIGGALLRKQTEEVLRESEESNRALLDAIPDLIFLFDRDGFFVDYKALDRKELIESPETFLNKHVSDVLPPNLADLTMQKIEHVFDKGELQLYEYTVELDNELKYYESRLVPCGKDKALSIVRDITERKQMEEALSHLATMDDLTGLFNRRMFIQKLYEEISRTKRFGGTAVIMMLDLDHFKAVNDTYGHGIGDTVLRKFAALLRSCVRETDIPGRLGGEEFGVLLPETTMEAATPVVRRILKNTRENFFATETGDIHLTISIGYTSFHADETRTDELLARADQALYRAKANGRDRAESG